METQAEKNKLLVKKAYEEIWIKRDIDQLASLISEDISYQMPGRIIQGKENYLEAIRNYWNTFEEAQMTIEHQMATEDKVYTRFTFRGKQTGPFGDVPATRKIIRFEGMDLIQIIDGRIIKEWEIIDELGLMQQLGLELVHKEHAH